MDISTPNEFATISKVNVVVGRTKNNFLYIHELAHQIQDITTISESIANKSISQEKKNELLFELELQADNYATDKIAKMDIDPTECEDVLMLYGLFKEKFFTTVKQLTMRQFNFFDFCYTNFGCEKIDDQFCSKIKKNYEDFKSLYRHYESSPLKS